MSSITRTTRTTPATRTNPLRFALRIGLAAALGLCILLAAGCGSDKTEVQRQTAEETGAFPMTLTDDASRTVTIDRRPERIVSLAPANTEILFALGAGDRVVGVTTYDDYPAEAKKIEKIGDFALPNMEKVAAVDPDIVFVTTGVQADVIGKLEDLGAVVIAIDPQTLDRLYWDIGAVAASIGAQGEGIELVADMKRSVADVKAKVSGQQPVTAFIEIGQNPLYTVGSGTLMDELLGIAGGRNVVRASGYVPYSAEALVKSNPEVYLATEGVASDPSAIGKRAGYDKLQAIKSGRVVILEDNLVSRPGPRIVLGLRQIAEGLHPKSFGK